MLKNEQSSVEGYDFLSLQRNILCPFMKLQKSWSLQVLVV